MNAPATDPSGARVVVRSTIVALPAEVVWQRLQQGETFLYVARGLLGVADPKAVYGTFQVGQTVRLRLRILHVIPAGWHELTIDSVDPQRRTMRTRERSWLLPVWNHTLSVEPVGENQSRYTDRIEFRARWFSSLAEPLVRGFFAHRQRRWRKLARETASV